MSRWKTGIACAVAFVAAAGIIGAAGNPGWFPSLHVGGGYGNTGVTVTDAGVVTANGSITSDGTVTALSRLDAYGGAGVGALLGSDTTGNTRTTNTNKAARFGTAHYSSSTPVGIFYAFNASNGNTIIFGGGTSALMAATTMQFHTAANNTTTNGTNRMTIASDGNVTIVNDLTIQGGDAYFGVTGTTRGVSNHYRGTSTNTPGATMLEALDGTDYYVWMGADGRLRRHTSLPTADTDGVPVAYAHPLVQSVTKNQTTPSVAGVNMVVIPGDWTAGNNITNFTGGQPGQHLVIQGGSSNCVVVDNANLWLAGNWTAANEASLTLMYNGSNWVELSRSAN